MYIQAGALTLLSVCLLASSEPTCYSYGPDVVSKFWDVNNYGSDGDVAIFAFGTDACNVGDEVLNWIGSTAEHPIIATNIYRIKNGVFRHVGNSWVKHGFSAAQSPNRCDCECIPSDDNQYLGVGCADAYGANTNGLQSLQGPRSEVNAYTGVFPFPPTGWGEGGSLGAKRLQVHHDDLESGNIGTATYVGEIQFVSAHDSLFGNQFNNSTWQPIFIEQTGPDWTIALSGKDHVGEPAIFAWQEAISSVQISESRPPDDGSIFVGALVVPISEGWFQYEYAIQNVNAFRSVQEVTIPIPIGGKILNASFHSLPYHSGEIIDDSPWQIEVSDSAISWSTEDHNANPMANALHWSSTFNFSFISNVPPQSGMMHLTPFRGTQTEETISTRAPSLLVDPCTLAQSPCPNDVTGDSKVTIADLLKVFEWWNECGDGNFAPPADTDGDCCVTVSDLLNIINDWNNVCEIGGACCLTNGDCIIASNEVGCQIAGGLWNGSYTTCNDANCNLFGACCLPGGSCEEDQTQSECYSNGGIFGGVDLLCNQMTCHIGADDCEDAPLINDGKYVIDTTDATTDGESHPKCNTDSDGGYTGNDKWLKYIAKATGTILISTCEDLGGGANYDTDLVFYHGNDCDSMTFVECDDDNSEYPCGSGEGGWHSAIFAPVEVGETYFIRVGGWTEGSVGEAIVLIEMQE